MSERTFRRWTRATRRTARPPGPPPRQGVGQAGPGAPGGGSRAALSRALPGFHGQAFPRASHQGHGFGWGYTWTKLHLQWAGVVPKAPRKGAHRRKRERRPLLGIMLHKDGSRHEWLEDQPALDLIVTLDDATGAISAFLVEEEEIASTFRALNEVFSHHGLPMSLYTDRGSHYFRTTKAGEISRGLPDPGRPGAGSGSNISAPFRRRRGAVRSGRSRLCRIGRSRS